MAPGSRADELDFLADGTTARRLCAQRHPRVALHLGRALPGARPGPDRLRDHPGPRREAPERSRAPASRLVGAPELRGGEALGDDERLAELEQAEAVAARAGEREPRGDAVRLRDLRVAPQ